MSTENANVCPTEKAGKQQPDNFFLIEFNEPDENAIEKVLKDTAMPPMPPPATGKLCECSGTVSGANGQFLQAVYLKNVAGQNIEITVEETLQSPYYANGNFASLAIPVNWTYPGQLPVAQGPAGSELWNTVRSVSLIFRPGSMGMELVLPHQTKKISYKGKGVDTCTAVFAAEEAPAFASTVSSFGATPTDRDPVDRDGDWLLYRNLSVSDFGAGSRLMQHGAPLRGHTVAFAAANVNWRRGQRRITYINRAAGESIVAIGPTVWFAGAPLSCVMVGQPTMNRLQSVIGSECRNNPEVIHMNADDDIYAQVNFDFNDFTSRAGGFDLWVKVID